MKKIFNSLKDPFTTAGMAKKKWKSSNEEKAKPAFTYQNSPN